jgi:hypothetical protein
MIIGDSIKFKGLISGLIYYKSIDKYWLIDIYGDFISDNKNIFIHFEDSFKNSKSLLIEKDIFLKAQKKEMKIICLKSELFVDLLTKLNLKK